MGSLNADLVQQVERFPRSGETLVGSDLNIVPGGKGANQAFAAARLGGHAQMIGRVGNDPFGPLLISSLAGAGVDTSRVAKSEAATGTASILVLPSGENTIVISPGANGKLTPQDALAQLTELDADCILLTQLEVPLETTEAALRLAHERGAITILDPAPARPLNRELLQFVHFLTPNQSEAALLLGSSRESESMVEAREAARALLALGPRQIALKAGALGVVIVDGEDCIESASFPVTAVDSTAAGDTWNGAFAVALAERKSVEQAARFANAAGALSVTRRGAQSSIPERSEVDALLASHGATQ